MKKLQPSDDLLISKTASLMDCLKQMDETHRKLLIVVHDVNKFFGLVSAGDIQRAIINNQSLDSEVCSAMRSVQTVASETDGIDAIRELMVKHRAEYMPVLSADGELVSVVFWEDLFVDEDQPCNEFELPIVIMAGGKGTRLKPFTDILPKPLFPLGDSTVLMEIVRRFETHGCKQFHFSLNYRKEFVQAYLDSLPASDSQYDVFVEPEPLGTIGSLSLIRKSLTKTFFVSNCDIIVDCDYGDILDYHRENNNQLTMVYAFHEMQVPYGVIDVGDNGTVNSISEKPTYTNRVNTGLYVVEPELLELIPDGEHMDMPTLIARAQSNSCKVGGYPIGAGKWHDTGEWPSYRQSLREFGSNWELS